MIFFVIWRGLKSFLKKIQKKEDLIFVFFFGFFLLWTTLFLSYSPIPEYEYVENSIPTFVAIGGFPFIAFHYPSPPMGSDVVSQSMWPLFYLNEFFWLIIGTILTKLLPQKIKNYSQIRLFCIVMTLIISLSGLGYLVLRFD